MKTQTQLLRQIDAMCNQLMIPIGMVDAGDFCGQGSRKLDVTVVVDRATQVIGLDGTISVGATEIELFQHELGVRPDVGDTVRVGDTLYTLRSVVSRDENRHRFAVQERAA